MSGFSPDPVSIEILSQGPDLPCRIRLTLPDGSGDSGTLNQTNLVQQISNLQNQLDSESQQLFGQLLYQALFPDNLSNQFTAALKASGERGIRLTLSIDPALPKIHRIPWERLYYPQGSTWLTLAASPKIVLSRFLQSGNPWGLPLQSGVLKILVVISSPFASGTNLYVDTTAEEKAIRDVLKPFSDQTEVEVLAGAISLQDITNRLMQGTGFDILHYIGHGDWREAEQTGYLILSKQYDDGSLGPDGVPAADIIQLLGASPHLPQLIFLAACESGQQSSSDAFTGVGPKLVQAGCPAVVCMQEKVEMDIARQFAVAFYNNLFESGCVDLAVNRARSGLLQHQYLQWSVPVLYMHQTDGLLFSPQARFRPDKRHPYKFLSPYLPEDSDLFKGRTEKISEIRQNIQHFETTIVYGESGVGLTSLLEAGLRPVLEKNNNLVVRIDEYHDLASAFRKGLTKDGRLMALRIPGDAVLPDILRAVGVVHYDQLILALDQFERVNRLPEPIRKNILDTLETCLQLNGVRLRLVFLLHEDSLPTLTFFQPLINKRSGKWLAIEPLKQEEALSAILDPLDVLNWPVMLNPTLVRELIVPDLGDLSPNEGEADDPVTIDPGQLQITCTWLYQKALTRKPPLIDEVLYLKEAGGANGILVRYMEEELKTRFAGQSDLARQVLVAMAAPEMERWILPEGLIIADVLPEQDIQPAVQAILDQLVRAELLVRRLKNDRYEYAFVNHMIREEAIRLGGEKIEQQYNARDEVERVWRLWLAAQTKLPAQGDTDQVLATRQQLRTLAESGQFFDTRLVKVLLLLRSAVLRGEPTQPWLGLLREREKLEDLIHTMEQRPDDQTTSSGSSGEYLSRILGINKLALLSNPTHYGEITRAAVFGKTATDRQTSVLALHVLDQEGQGTTRRLEAAFVDIPSKWQRFWRRSELFGTLAEAGLPSSDQNGIGIYLWRAGRRIFLQRQMLIWSFLGAALGAGVGLGVERLLTGLLAQSPTAVIFFALFSYWGFLIGGLTALGTRLSRVLLVKPASSPQFRGLSVLLGAAGFGLANLVVALLNGISLQQAPLVIPLGFIAGLGISMVFSVNPQKTSQRLFISLLAAVWFAFVQLIFLVFPTMGSGLSIALSSAYFQVEFEYFSAAVWQNWINTFQDWPSVLSLIESGLAGLVLTFWGASGLHLAEKWYRRWLNFIVSVEN